jgi:NDP-sugar pyrophosphorylase family protein
MAKGERIAAHIGEGRWHELSTLQRYLDISLDLLAAQNRTVFAGDRTSVPSEAKIRDAILWNDVVVEDDATVTRSIIGDGVRVRAQDAFEDSVVVRAELVAGMTPPAKALKGRFQDDKFVVPLSQ